MRHLSAEERKVFFAVTLTGLFTFLMLRSTPVGWDFRNNLWGPAYLLTHGQSPYHIDVLYDVGNALWMPMSVGFFAPLGFLPVELADHVWLLINLGAAVAVCWMVVSTGQRSVPFQVLSVAALIISPLSISHYVLGQTTFLLMMFFLVIVLFREKLPLILTALFMALALAKPQIAVLVLPGSFLLFFRKNGIRKTFSIFLLLLAWILLLSAILFLGSAEWIVDFQAQLARNPSWSHPSSLSVMRVVMPEIGGYVWGVYALAVMTLNVWLWWKLPAEEAVLWSLALTPAVTPYTWSWDFVLLLPLFLSRLNRYRAIQAQLVMIGVYACSWVFLARIRMAGMSDFNTWWVPSVYIGAVLISGYLDRRQRSLRQIGEEDPGQL